MSLDVGTVYEGKISGITKFGAFVSLANGKVGLVHISEIARTYVSDVNDFLSEGQAVRVKVIGVDNTGRVSLSIKQADEPPASPPPVRAERAHASRQHASGNASGSPSSFEDKLKRFMQDSDNKISGLKRDKRSGARRDRRG